MGRMGDLEIQLAEISGSFTTESGMVSISLGSDLALREIHITPRAMRLQSHDLADEIVAAHAGAREAVQAAVSEVMRDFLGSDGEIDDMLQKPQDLQNAMTETLHNISESMNDAIVALSRIRPRQH